MWRLIFLLLLLLLNACEKPPGELSDTLIHFMAGGDANDWGVDLVGLSDGGFIMAGVTESYGVEHTDEDGRVCQNYWLLKLDASGNLLWQKDFKNRQRNLVYQIAEDAQHNLVIAGHTGGNDGVEPERFYPDIWVVQLSPQGQLLAETTLGGSEPELVRSICCTSDGGYLLAGSTLSDNGDVQGLHTGTSFGNDAWIVKLDARLQMIWQRCLGGSANDYGLYALENDRGNYSTWSVSESSDGDLENPPSVSRPSLWFVELDSAGNLLNQSFYPDIGYGWVMACGVNSRNDLLGVGIPDVLESLWWEFLFSWDSPLYHPHTELFLCDQYGRLQWQKKDWLNTEACIFSVRKSRNEDFLLAGRRETASDGREMLVASIAPNGNLNWMEYLGGDFSDCAYAAIPTLTGHYLVTGSTESRESLFGDFNNDAFVYELVK